MKFYELEDEEKRDVLRSITLKINRDLLPDEFVKGGDDEEHNGHMLLLINIEQQTCEIAGTFRPTACPTCYNVVKSALLQALNTLEEIIGSN